MESNLFKALNNIAFSMESKIENRNGVKWVTNPVNKTENFADKWPTNPKLQRNFYKWIERLKQDIDRLSNAKGLDNFRRILNEMFDEKVTGKTYANYSKLILERRKSGDLKASANSVTLGLTGITKVPQHNFYGAEKEEG